MSYVDATLDMSKSPSMLWKGGARGELHTVERCCAQVGWLSNGDAFRELSGVHLSDVVRVVQELSELSVRKGQYRSSLSARLAKLQGAVKDTPAIQEMVALLNVAAQNMPLDAQSFHAHLTYLDPDEAYEQDPANRREDGTLRPVEVDFKAFAHLAGESPGLDARAGWGRRGEEGGAGGAGGAKQRAACGRSTTTRCGWSRWAGTRR